ANAGGTYSLNLGAVNDPGQTVSQYLVHWGDGSPIDVYSNTGTVTHPYTATGSDTISVDLVDGNGTIAGAGTLPVTVTQPTLTLSGAAGVFQGQSYKLTISPPIDLGGTSQQYIVHWGEGNTDTYSAATTQLIASHVYTGPLQAAITADLVDNTGTFLSAGSKNLTVAAPPTVSLTGSANANVGGTYTLNLSGVVDSIGTVSSYIVHWGDNTTNTAT